MDNEVQEEGWPLGLRPLNGRIGLVRNEAAADHADGSSVSFSATLFSTAASAATSDFDTQSRCSSLFDERSITLGRLMGIPNMQLLDLSSRRRRRRFTTEDSSTKGDGTGNSKGNNKQHCFFFSLCSNLYLPTPHH